MDQNVSLYARKRMELTGVEEVEGFSDTLVTLRTSLGRAAVEGNGLRIDSFSTEAGKLVILGEIDSLSYYGEENGEERRGFFGRWFR